MTAGEKMLNLTIELSGVILCAMAILLVVVGAKVDKRTERYFIFFYSGLIMLSVSNMAGLLMRGLTGAGFRTALYVSNYLEFLLPTLLIYLVTHYLLLILDPAHQQKRLRFLILALLVVDIAMLTASQFTGLYYIIDPDNFYRRQPLFPLSFLISFLMMLIDFCLLVRDKDKLTKKERIAFWSYFLLPTAAIALQTIQYGINFTIYSTIIAGLIMYIFIVSDQTERYYRERERNAKLQVDIMLSQIQPHFLYNSLGAIQHLCRNAPEAKAAIMKFSRYLRGNMDSISQDVPIPFTTELEHTKTYLELEQLRFGDELNVVYDLQCTAFLLPTLTLQPLVENAVRHGVRGSETGVGTVTVSSRELDNRYEITVADDGTGFDPEERKEDGCSHIGLDNVRERLKRVSGGTLRIESAPGQGSRVTIVLPKEGTKHADIRHR